MTAELRDPDPSLRTSFLAAMVEFADEGRARDGSMLGGDLAEWGADWADPARLAAYVSGLRAERTVPRRPGFVTSSHWWWAEDETYLGQISLRHELTPLLRETGGHIGYNVRRSARRVAHATAMLAAVLPLARARGIEQALLTCDVANVGSRAVIEACGGVFEDERSAKLRFWIDTATS